MENPISKWMIFLGENPLFSETPTWGKMLHQIFDDWRILWWKEKHHHRPKSPRSELEDEIDLGFEGAEVPRFFWGFFFWRKNDIFI